MEIRKVKEMEYEILTSAIKGWEGEVSLLLKIQKKHQFMTYII